MRPTRWPQRPLVLAVMLLALALPVAPADTGGAAAPRSTRACPSDGPACAPCPPDDHPVYGRACRLPDGRFALFASNGLYLGTTHGADPLPAQGTMGPSGDGLAAFAAPYPHCVDGAPGDYYVTVIYARAFDDEDRYAALAGQLRALTHAAQDFIAESARASGGAAGLKVKCTDGVIRVHHEVLPTPMAKASWSTMTGDLIARGYGDGRVKYLVFYDDTEACEGCVGLGAGYGDDRPGAENWNNGNGGPLYAAVFGYEWSVGGWLHEFGHSSGAVQTSAPHSDGGGHCNEQEDIMCGPGAAACAAVVWDCRNDDYFSLNPPPTNYLARHWNIGSRVNRFLEFPTEGPSPLWVDGPRPTEIGQGTIRIEGGLAAEPPATVEVRVDGGPYRPATVRDGRWSIDWDSSQADDGGFHVEARLSSERVNGAATWTVFANREPRVAILDPPRDRWPVAGTIGIRGTASDADLRRVDVYVNNVGWLPTRGTETWNATWNTRTVADGPTWFAARAWDGGSNRHEFRWVVVDNTAPTARIAVPAPRSYSAGVANVPPQAGRTEGPAVVVGPTQIRVAAEDGGVGVAYVHICVLDADRGGVPLSCVKDPYAVLGRYHSNYWLLDGVLDAGNRTVTAQAFDRAGNGSPVAAVDVEKL